MLSSSCQPPFSPAIERGDSLWPIGFFCTVRGQFRNPVLLHLRFFRVINSIPSATPPRKLTWQWKIQHEWKCMCNGGVILLMVLKSGDRKIVTSLYANYDGKNTHNDHTCTFFNINMFCLIIWSLYIVDSEDFHHPLQLRIGKNPTKETNQARFGLLSEESQLWSWRH